MRAGAFDFLQKPIDPDVLLIVVERALERRELAAALVRSGGNRTRAAEALGLSRQGLLKKLERFGLS